MFIEIKELDKENHVPNFQQKNSLTISEQDQYVSRTAQFLMLVIIDKSNE